MHCLDRTENLSLSQAKSALSVNRGDFREVSWWCRSRELSQLESLQWGRAPSCFSLAGKRPWEKTCRTSEFPQVPVPRWPVWVTFCGEAGLDWRTWASQLCKSSFLSVIVQTYWGGWASCCLPCPCLPTPSFSFWQLDSEGTPSLARQWLEGKLPAAQKPAPAHYLPHTELSHTHRGVSVTGTACLWAS